MGFSNERFGYHVVYDRDIHDAIEFASSHGFGYIVPDLNVPRFWPERIDRAERRRISRYAEDLGASISFHGPTYGLNLTTPYPEVRQGVMDRMKACLKLASDLQAERFTIHPSQPPNFVSGGKPGTFLDDHWELYKEALIEGIRGTVAEAGDVQVCLENDPLSPFVEEVLEELILEEDRLYLAFDPPKAMDTSRCPSLGHAEAFYQRHVDRVREVHLHDRRPDGTYHDMLGHGEVDVRKYLRMFAPHDVHFTLEIRPRENAHRSLLLIERLWEELF